MSSPPASEPGPLSRAQELYAQYLALCQQGEVRSFESWCAMQPEDAVELRRLHAQYEQLMSIFDRLSSLSGAATASLGGERRLADELRARFGEGVDPGIYLDGGRPIEDSGPSSELLRRLRVHAPKGSRYRLLGEIGRGGMGAVVRVWDADLRRTLAMKVVLGKQDKAANGATAPVDSKTLGRFLEEAQITGQLDHPGIVPVHDLGLGTDGEVYFTMRLVKGEDLRKIFDYVAGGREDWNTTRALSVMLKVCEAMAYAHSKGVIHRDLKPANIMVGRYGEVYVMDWGLARAVGVKDLHDLRLKDLSQSAMSQSVRTERREERSGTPDSPLVTMDGDVMGTPAYMSPEQARGEVAQLGPHSDVYAVGAMLYHLLLVKHIEMPYVAKGARMSQHRVLMLAQEGAPTALAQFDKSIPAPLVAIVEKAMSRELFRRYSDMEALATDLRAYLDGRVVAAYETGTWAETKQWVKRNKPLAASIAIGLLVLVAGVGFSWSFAFDANAERARADAERLKASEAARVAEEERARTAEFNRQLQTINASLVAQAREQKLRGMMKELARFRAQCRTLEGLDRLGKPAYLWWLENADRLLNGVVEDLDNGIEWQPGISDVQARLVELRGSPALLPYTAEDRERDFELHPERSRLRELEVEAAEFEGSMRESLAELESRIVFTENRLRSLEFPADVAVADKFAGEMAISDARKLNLIAWPMVDPEAVRPGPEDLVRAMLLARRGVELADDMALRSSLRDTLAWSLLWLGRFDEAVAQSQRAIEESDGKASLNSNLAQMREHIDSWSAPRLWERAEELSKWKSEFSLRRDRLDADIAARKADLESQVALLKEVCSRRRTWRFGSSPLELWHEQLEELESQLLWLSQMKEAAVAAHLTQKAQLRWSEAIEGIARSPKYAGQAWPSGERMTPQAGLLPLGENPVTGLWEFVHLQTGSEPELGMDGRVLRDVDGRLSLKRETGMVLVLIPGGRFWMGAQNAPGAQNHAAEAEQDELPVREVELRPYFISKYELTADQWDRVSLRRGKSTTSGKQLTPANDNSWDDISAMWLRELGWCGFPSEAQWEHSCRAGTSTNWSTGNAPESLLGAANLDFDDSNRAEILPINTLRANGFGLHDIHGNVWEWCGDTYNSGVSPRAGDGLRDDGTEGSVSRVLRGGGWSNVPSLARSAYRSPIEPGERNNMDGLRPARGVTP
jgi:serine/threonine protein kinase/formylglycine-generating enzyme required for sulfatase activity